MLTCDRTIAIYFIVLSVQTRTRNFVRRCIKDGQRNHDKVESMFVIKITFLDYTLFFYLFLLYFYLYTFFLFRFFWILLYRECFMENLNVQEHIYDIKSEKLKV